MRKSDKKLDNQLRLALTDVCETALKQLDGFQWLTHLVNYNNFPSSLRIVFIFDSNDHLAQYLQSNDKDYLLSLLQTELQPLNLKLKNIAKHVEYDTEESCESQHQGNWALRLG
ncbi:Fis family transcriptional regulator [Catenovulum sp. SM1970]|uniref:Fis family transcriptional regulator n=1 Tax=Marinifaba aquimaris TaxID=2741323 RepID=UPI001572E99A|nr:Fis family transcriptional regulator [Marinifaba aquimaris]NTS76812.1 Fis family transcriptional regulator [Marinifaba aquimaris]